MYSVQFAGGGEEDVHGAGGLADGIEDADGVLEIVDAGGERAFGKGDMAGLDGKRYGVAVAFAGAVDAETYVYIDVS